jgi:hypothetical protein
MAQADAMRNRTALGLAGSTALLRLAPGANRHAQRKFTLERHAH